MWALLRYHVHPQLLRLATLVPCVGPANPLLMPARPAVALLHAQTAVAEAVVAVAAAVAGVAVAVAVGAGAVVMEALGAARMKPSLLPPLPAATPPHNAS